MQINPINPVKKIDSVEARSNEVSKKTSQAKANIEDAYIPTKKQIEKATYEKPSPKADESTINKLRADSERAYSHLRQLVAQLLEKQGKAYQGGQSPDSVLIETVPDTDEMVEITDEIRLEAQTLTAEGGELSVEAVSDRIVEFAKSISGGDKTKLDVLRGAIEEGFKEAAKILGGLPDISNKTYDMVMQKLDAWIEE